MYACATCVNQLQRTTQNVSLNLPFMVTIENETAHTPLINSIANTNRFLHRFKKILLTRQLGSKAAVIKFEVRRLSHDH